MQKIKYANIIRAFSETTFFQTFLQNLEITSPKQQGVSAFGGGLLFIQNVSANHMLNFSILSRFKGKMQYHHMLTYHPLHRYEIFNVSKTCMTMSGLGSYKRPSPLSTSLENIT